jgi:hypothetical protein
MVKIDLIKQFETEFQITHPEFFKSHQGYE